MWRGLRTNIAEASTTMYSYYVSSEKMLGRSIIRTLLLPSNFDRPLDSVVDRLEERTTYVTGSTDWRHHCVNIDSWL